MLNLSYNLDRQRRYNKVENVTGQPLCRPKSGRTQQKAMAEQLRAARPADGWEVIGDTKSDSKRAMY